MIPFSTSFLPSIHYTSILVATLLCSCLGSPRLSAQSYMPLPFENAEWSLSTAVLDGMLERFVFEGDTILNGQLYHKAQNRAVCENSIFANRFWAYFRTDATNSRLWVYSSYSNQETLVMDLNLEVGDVVDITVFNETWPIPVVSVEQIEGRKVINFWYEAPDVFTSSVWDYGPFRYIEGIGPTWINTGGASYSAGLLPLGLSCIKQDGETIFENQEMYQGFQYCADTCYVIFPIATNERQQSLPVSLFPNPSDGFLNISSEAPLAQYSLYTLDGRLLQTATLRAEQEQLDLRQYARGIYWLRIQDRQGHWALRKVFRR